jgi:probable phosphoglycerate mutase
VTRYELTAGGSFELAGFNGVEHLAEPDDAPVTEENDVPSPA